ncbi:MAG: HD domain-containing protein [Ruminococcus sp.]|jgi:HD superfamily phosphodiesterase|nr:HD domain-containing protein [Ruminococcus sp.]
MYVYVQLTDVIDKMVEYEAGNAARIGHFLKVHSYAAHIGNHEKLGYPRQLILEIAAIMHDIGIKPALEKYGSSAGQYQEELGPAAALEMIKMMELPDKAIERICFLVGHHHTYTDVDGKDWQILLEADFLVNMEEEKMSEKMIESAYKKVFKTPSGKRLCEIIYGVNAD